MKNKTVEEAEVGEEFEYNGNKYYKFNETQAALVIDESWLMKVEETNKEIH